MFIPLDSSVAPSILAEASHELLRARLRERLEPIMQEELTKVVEALAQDITTNVTFYHDMQQFENVVRVVVDDRRGGVST